MIEAGDCATAKGLALTAEDALRADIIERLMCDLRVDLPAVLLGAAPTRATISTTNSTCCSPWSATVWLASIGA